MLSWSSTESGEAADLSAIADGSGDGGLPFGREIIEFVDAIGGKDAEQLARARDQLVEAAGELFMIDTAAVVANFEMMTRVADGTGARFPLAGAARREQLDAQLGISGFTSAR